MFTATIVFGISVAEKNHVSQVRPRGSRAMDRSRTAQSERAPDQGLSRIFARSDRGRALSGRGEMKQRIGAPFRRQQVQQRDRGPLLADELRSGAAIRRR